MFSKKAISRTKIQGIFLRSDKVSIHLCIHHSLRMLQSSLFYAELGNTPSSVQLSMQFRWPRNLIRLLNAMSLHLEHTKSGSASLLRCSVHGTHSRVSALLTAQSGGCKLLESINNANKLCHPGSQPRGIILLGDSAGAHFRISPEWITASQMALVSNFGSNHPGCTGLCVCFPLLSLNVMPTPNRCKFPFSAKSAIKGTSTAISDQLISNNVSRNERALPRQAHHESRPTH